MNFYCFVDVSTDKAIIIKTNKSKNNYKNTFNLNVTKNYVYHFKFESYIVWSYLIYVRTRPHYKLNPHNTKSLLFENKSINKSF
jgi:hypothetical protein